MITPQIILSAMPKGCPMAAWEIDKATGRRAVGRELWDELARLRNAGKLATSGPPKKIKWVRICSAPTEPALTETIEVRATPGVSSARRTIAGVTVSVAPWEVRA